MEPGHFTWQRPRLMDVAINDMEKANACKNLVVELTFLPMMAAGPTKMPTLHLLATELKMNMSVPADANALLRSVVEELQDIAAYLQVLTGDTSESGVLQILDKITKSTAGCRQLVRQNTLQTPCYKQAEMKIRKAEVNAMTLMPKLEKVKSALENAPSVASVEAFLQEAPALKDGLAEGQQRARRVQPLYDKTAVFLAQDMERLNAGQVTHATLAEMKALTDLAKRAGFEEKAAAGDKTCTSWERQLLKHDIDKAPSTMNLRELRELYAANAAFKTDWLDLALQSKFNEVFQKTQLMPGQSYRHKKFWSMRFIYRGQQLLFQN
eukprot:6485293-Amphidinium_carterae.2